MDFFAETTFVHGFLHCDPHAANVLVRAREGEEQEEGICENCYGAYKDVEREQPPCFLCQSAFRDAWTRSRYGSLSCETCDTVYNADATTACSACNPQFIEDCCGPQNQDNEDNEDYDRYGREYCRTYGV
jgi:hypothetical protein